MSEKKNGEFIASAAHGWWRRHREDRGAMAELRRARGLVEPLMIPAGLALLRAIGPENDWQVARVAAIAHVLAFLREDDLNPVARAIGKPNIKAEDSAALVKPIRLRRLLSIQDDELAELATAMRRLARMLKGRGNVRDFARSIYFWNESTRRDWAMRWHGVGIETGGGAGEGSAPDPGAADAA